MTPAARTYWPPGPPRATPLAIARRLRSAHRVGRTVVLRLRYGDYTRATRSHTLAQPTDDTQVVLRALRALLVEATPLIHDRGITLVGIAVANLDGADAVQLILPFDGHGRALDAALDDVRARFGTAAVTRAVHLGRDLGPDAPMLPD